MTINHKMLMAFNSCRSQISWHSAGCISSSNKGYTTDQYWKYSSTNHTSHRTVLQLPWQVLRGTSRIEVWDSSYTYSVIFGVFCAPVLTRSVKAYSCWVPTIDAMENWISKSSPVLSLTSYVVVGKDSATLEVVGACLVVSLVVVVDGTDRNTAVRLCFLLLLHLNSIELFDSSSS